MVMVAPAVGLSILHPASNPVDRPRVKRAKQNRPLREVFPTYMPGRLCWNPILYKGPIATRDIIVIT
jgi:hypothetical protein